jgi:phosphatidylglycerophosphate synthase
LTIDNVAQDSAKGPDVADSAAVGGPRGYRQALSELGAAQKPAKGAPAYSRFINRRLGRYLAAAAYQVGLTPNIVTAISAAFSFTGIALLALGRPAVLTGCLVSAALVVGYAFDAADGQLARLVGAATKSGEWLDHMVDSAKISSLHLAVLISCYRFFGFSSAEWLLIPLAFAAVANVTFFGMILNDQLRRVAAATGRSVEHARPSTLRSVLVIPTDYGVLCLAFVLLGWHEGFFGLYAALLLANAGFLFLAAAKWFRDMKALD